MAEVVGADLHFKVVFSELIRCRHDSEIRCQEMRLMGREAQGDWKETTTQRMNTIR
jgi:hypothetical protein